MEIAGLPLHPLVVHATVVIVPLAALLAVLFSLVPRWRWWARWPAAAVALLALGLAWVAKLSGQDLLEARPELGQLVVDHQRFGDLLANLMIPFALLVVAAAWSLGGPTGLASGRGARESQLAVLDKVLPVLVVVAALAVLVMLVRTGDAGARAVWG